MFVVMTEFFNQNLHNDVLNIVTITEIRLLCCKIANLAYFFLIFHISPNLRSNFSYYRCLECFRIILRISKLFGSKDGATKILTMISLQKCQFLAIQIRKSVACTPYSQCLHSLFLSLCQIRQVSIYL